MLQAIKESKKAEGVGTYPRRRVPPAAEYAGRTILDTPHPRADASSFSGGFIYGLTRRLTAAIAAVAIL